LLHLAIVLTPYIQRFQQTDRQNRLHNPNFAQAGAKAVLVLHVDDVLSCKAVLQSCTAGATSSWDH